MKTVDELLLELRCLNVKLWTEGNSLRYEAAKETLSPALLAQLKEQEAEILAILKQSDSYSYCPLEDTTSFCSLSHGQQALWFLYQMAPKSVAYNIFLAARLDSDLDVDAWERVWKQLVDRHTILRTTYAIRNGQPVQQIHSRQEVEIEVIDASSWSEEYLKVQIYQETDRLFDLECGPVLRVKLFSNTTQGYIQLIVMHHIAGDMWSFDLLIEEFQVLYAAEIHTVSSISLSIPFPKCQYTDYVCWQTDMLEIHPEKLWTYWHKQLEGELPILNLPTDRPYPPVQTYRGDTTIFQLDPELIPKLKKLKNTHRASLYTIMLTAFFALLYRYTGQEDILIGTPIAGRSDSKEFQKIVGYFPNITVLRGNLAGNPTFKELLTHIRSLFIGALQHQEAPFSLLLEKLKIQRDRSRFPLVSVCFSWHKYRSFQTSQDREQQAMKIEILPHLGVQRGAIVDINFRVMEVGNDFQVAWEYSTDLFDAATITQMQSHYQNLLEGIVANPEQRLGELPLFTARERHQLLIDWNNTYREYPQDKCIHELFTQLVELTPNAVALVCADQQITYQELNQKANQLAHYLQSLGVGTEILVGICVERSLLMIVGLLGILKAGGVYVPLDLTSPQEDLAYILEETQVSVLLTQAHLLTSLPAHQLHLICLDTDENIIAQYSPENPATSMTSANLAYVMYTSASTGKPKGVSITHRNVVHLIKGNNYANFTKEDVFLQLASINFDAATLEIWGSLLNGARLVLMPPQTLSLLELGQAIRQYQVTTLYLTPGLFRLLVDEQLVVLKQLKQLLVRGDVISIPYAKKLLQAAPELKLINGYGPTENTTFTCCYQVTAASNLNATVPIGRPIPNTQVYLLDMQLQPVAVGVPGEIYIGGDGLARGYFNQPELTAKTFIPHPFSSQPEARLYKTAGLARYLPDGNIEFLGRIDQQVKIRGFRIQLADIENALTQHPKVQQAVVTINENQSGDKYLVAYVVAAEPANKEKTCTLKSTALRSFLQQKLPDYMVPVTFVILKHIPLTPNFEVNHKALPETHLHLQRDNQFVPPQTPTEAVIADIIATVIGLEEIGIHDNFFALGGNSFLAMQVISRLRQAYQIELPLGCLFGAPTVAELEKLIISYRQTDLGQIVPFITPVSQEQAEFPLSFAQARLWFLDQLVGKSATYNLPFAVRLVGNLNINVLERSIREIVQRHASLRTHFQVVNGLTVQVINPTATITLPVVNLQNTLDQDKEVQQLAKIEAHIPFDLAGDSLIRVKLLQLSQFEYVLLLTIHHIVCDAWSMEILLQELSSLYPAFCAGKPSPLPDLPIQYVDYTLWQWELLTTKVLQQHLNYWTRQLVGVQSSLELPTDKPRKSFHKFRGSSLEVDIDAQLSQELKTLSQQSGVTLFMTLLAAFVTLLYRYSDRGDILVGSPIANRHHQATKSLIGLFVNLLVLRFKIPENLSFSQLLHQVRDVALAAVVHQDVPFEQLLKTLQPDRSLSQSPLVQVVFNLETAPRPWELPGISVNPINIESMTAKFDLTLSMVETATALKATWEYNSDLFEHQAIASMSEHFQTLLAVVATNPNQTLAQINLLTDAECAFSSGA
ncbi:MAG: amino acid adenylation domain-containing protein [Aulosira sp. ZfuVER01]|nr:amino acid adenylation domain-containing protein [Aulosira sp. ZfuVER01]MDZ7999568.1 amino acid adenylation domain-containing protein [Aulosira sp. DedVER01a]MDZ8053983.1 amino acid adenylation domain-containing protein [Aulosira sp. ZfuCHP01]